MPRRLMVAIVFLVLGVIVTACGSPEQAAALPTTTPAPVRGSPTPTATFLPPPTVTPFPTAAPGRSPDGVPRPPLAASATQTAPHPAPDGPPVRLEPGQLIFTTGFDQGWPTIDEATAKIRPAGGAYLFEIGPNALRYLSTTAVDVADMYAQVEVLPESCPSSGGYGLFFRMADAGNYYALTIFCDNRLTVFARSAGALVGDALVDTNLPDGLDAAAPVTHNLSILAEGSSFTVCFDGQAAASFTSDLHARGDVAVYAVSPADDVLRVAFDNLKVWTVY